MTFDELKVLCEAEGYGCWISFDEDEIVLDVQDDSVSRPNTPEGMQQIVELIEQLSEEDV